MDKETTCLDPLASKSRKIKPKKKMVSRNNQNENFSKISSIQEENL